jgi:tRNA-splicing ligase RtcB (3'-phosphate/5'-hydroxy nucleic acid ligase)
MEKFKTLIPMEMIEQTAISQIYKVRELPFLLAYRAFPDIHAGMTLPIGSVVIFDNVISSDCVGSDIACRVSCIVTDVLIGTTDIIKNKWKILDELHKRIPTGHNGRKYTDYTEFKSASGNKTLNNWINNKIHTQIGSLGGGNHFADVGFDRNGCLAFTIHSGSRNIGKTIQEFYSKIKEGGFQKGFFKFNGGDIGQQYYQDMLYAEKFSNDNHIFMMNDILSYFGLNFKKYENSMINIQHNHAEILEDNKILHRKGATPAHKGQFGLIPGNSRDGTFIVKGLGNKEWLNSCSHGAGRVMSRGDAKRNIDLDEFSKQVENIATIVSPHTLDEAPDAYKNINEVIKMQEGVVINVINHITPVIVVKDNSKGRKRRK